jgi:hypothetical protein
MYSVAGAHPGIAIVKDSKGNIFYSDLRHVWKISNGKKSVAVPDVHTHELYMDTGDNLYGEHVIYEDNAGEQWFHFMWLLRPDGILDTVVGLKQAYIEEHYSLARDIHGVEYYTKAFLREPDTSHIFKRTPGKTEEVFATGDFKGVAWLHPQTDGSLLFVKDNAVWRINAHGKRTLVASNIGNEKPSFEFSGSSIIVWGLWEDSDHNVYAAVFSDQEVKRITPDGKVSVYYTSKGNYAPTQGVFDNEGALWLMESSDQNEVRVIKVPPRNEAMPKKGSSEAIGWWLPAGGALLLIILILFFSSVKTKDTLAPKNR